MKKTLLELSFDDETMKYDLISNFRIIPGFYDFG